jgi:hypothetical protein
MKVVIDTTKNIILKTIVLILFVIVLIGVIAYARGYRVNFDEGKLTSTGIVSVSSAPKPAKVYVNGELKGATDVNLTLPFGQYTVEVKKDGYTSWEKSISLKGEIVMSLDAHLFPKNPSLTPLTNLGIVKAVPMGNTDKIILFSQTGDVEKDGIYLFESSKRTIAIFPPLTPLLLKSVLPANVDLSTAQVEFSPNYRQAILTLMKDEKETSYLISLENENTELFDITTSKQNILQAWNNEKNQETAKVIETLPEEFHDIAMKSFQIISVAPNEKRIMYRAKQAAQLPLVMNPPLIGANQTPEVRNLEVGGIYIYDKKEDKNYKVPVEISISESVEPVEETSTLQATDTNATDSAASKLPKLWYPEVVEKVTDIVQWYPTSDYIAVKEKNRIIVMQYDGDNKETIYAGPFQSDFFMIAPDWNLLVVINLNPQANTFGDLYSVGIK